MQLKAIRQTETRDSRMMLNSPYHLDRTSRWMGNGLVLRSLWLGALSSVLLLSGCDFGDIASSTSRENTEIKELQVLPEARGLLPDLALADSAFESDHYTGRGNCTSCHDGDNMQVSTDAGFLNVSIGAAFETSAMANSARDPFWHATVAAELYRYPELGDDINSTCTVCHIPMAVDMARKEGLEVQPLDSGSVEAGDFVAGLYGMDRSSPLFNHAMDGVSCSFCHQLADVGLGDESSFSGGFTVLPPPADIADRPAYGQYADPDSGYMRQQSATTPLFGAHLSTSEACATCHNMDNHSVDKDGNRLAVGASFPVQTIYTEWQQSDFAVGNPLQASCQSCHMPKLDKPVFLSSLGGAERPDFAEHSFLAANTVLQDMLHNFSEELGVPEGIDFMPAIERNRQFLTGAAELSIESVSRQNGKLNLTLDVQNRTGHKLPSGYHSRRVYLHVLVMNEQGEVTFESGRINADGSIDGVDEDRNPVVWESHHEIISDPSQVQVYQSIMSDSDGERTHSLLNGVDYFKDNRLLPSGLAKAGATPDVAVKGLAVDDADFDAGGDRVQYQVALEGDGVYTVLAELRYQPLSFAHMQDLFLLSGKLDTVDRFRTLYEATSLRDEVIDTATTLVP